MATQVTLTTTQKVPVTFAPVTSSGAPATLDGPLETEVVSGDVTAEVQEDGLTVMVISGDTVGEAQIIVRGDGDLGAGVRHIEETLDVSMTNDEAVSLTVTVGAPIPKDGTEGGGEVDPNAPHPDQTLPGDLPGGGAGRRGGAGSPGGKPDQELPGGGRGPGGKPSPKR